MGVRTYLEEELAKAREKPKLRKVHFISFLLFTKKHILDRLIILTKSS